MRYITIPEAAVFDDLPNNPTTGKPNQITFAQLLKSVLVTDVKVTADHASLDRYVTLADEGRQKAPGTTWAVSDEDHEFLSKIAKDFPYNADIKLAMLRTLVRAITGASKEKPVEVTQPKPVSEA